MYTEEKERGDVSLAKRRGEEGRHNYIYIYIHTFIEVGMLGATFQRHGFMNGGPRKKQPVGQLVPVDSDNCVARAGIRGQNESTLAC